MLERRNGENRDLGRKVNGRREEKGNTNHTMTFCSIAHTHRMLPRRERLSKRI